ncbi:zinc finger CCCH domain-containing protein 19 isoform X2 [Salvia hispanica]|uniref:zinc finger CCCH domain-containing protein 19 isoform X2 n=1 Tax=Salvia hispanica TaxID=49212 RepID=UPI002009D5C6|nr:zinc finger CCCH domain-containing protein 19 isoform X2 [Salvia hispanica]
MDEENLGVSAIDGAGECGSIAESGDSTVIGGEKREVASVEDETVAVGGGTVEVLAEDGGGEVAASEPLEEGANRVDGEEGADRVDCAEKVGGVAADGVNTHVLDESVVNKEGDEMAIDPDSETKNEEEIVHVVDAKLEVDVTHSESQSDTGGVEIAEDTHLVLDAKLEVDVTQSESQLDAGGVEIAEDTHLEVKGEEEFRPVADTDAVCEQQLSELQTDLAGGELNLVMEGTESLNDHHERELGKEEVDVAALGGVENESVADTDAVCEQQLSELQTDGAGGELNLVMEGTESLNDHHERELGQEEVDVATMGGVENESVERMTVDNYAETAARSDDVAVERGDFLVNDSECGAGEKSTEVEEEEKGDAEAVAEITAAEVETDDSVHLAKVSEQEQVHESNEGLEDVSGHERNKHAEDEGVVAAEESQVSEAKMVDDENFSLKVSSDANLDVHLNESEYKEDTDLPVRDIKQEEESRVESEMTRNAEVDHLAKDADMGTNSIDSKTPDDEGKMETEDTMSDVDETAQDMYDSPGGLQDEEDETIAAEEETGTQDTEMETETDMAESGKSSGGKRKRAKLTKSPSITRALAKGSSRKTVGEDVCFICFDGGELVLCDRRGCPKAYHPSCVNRDEAFFKSKGRWNCGWHLCSICEKNARYMCYTCTFSLCKSCTKDATILCVRGNKGFCETCMRTVMLIENNEQAQIDFDDRSSWEYLFKDYYLELKAKLSLSSSEILEARNPWKGADVSGTSKTESAEVKADANEGGSDSDDSVENSETVRPKRRKIRKQSKSRSKVDTGVASRERAVSSSGNSEWASQELLEFVSHMKNGDISLLSQFDVQALLLEYIKINKLRDPRRKSQIVCDARLETLFGKPRVGHFEMLKLIESHFLIRDEQNDDLQGIVVDTENDQLDIEASPETLTKGGKDKKRKSRKKGDNRGPQSNLDDYAAIDMHNIGLIYLRRKLMEDLLEDTETFNEKVIGTFVRIRISGSNQKQDLYRIVQVVGTSKAAEPYKVGKRTTETMVEILNLDKTEIISIDTISNQEFTEDECKRLRQSIKCGLISPLTVGEILDKTTEIQVARVNDWLESETLRLSHLRDRASDLGRRKELRECVEKLQLLKTPEERQRRLDEIPEIHADPKMDPSHESEDNDSDNEDARRDTFMRSRGSGFSKRGRGPISPGRDNYVKESWSGGGKATPSRNLSGNNFSTNTGHIGEIVNENLWNLDRDKSTQDSDNFNRPNSTTIKSESAERAQRTVSRPESASGVASLPSQGSYSAGAAEPAVKINESEKMWQYQDPSGKVQGPFSMVQLRKWNNTGYFPANLKIWRATEKQENSVLLVDALAGKFPRALPAETTFPATSALHSSHTLAGHPNKISATLLPQENERAKLIQSSGSHSNMSAEKWSGNDTTNLPSPTPKQSNAGWSGGKEAGHLTVAVQSPSANGGIPSSTAVLPNLANHPSNPATVLNSVVQNTNFTPAPKSHPGIMVSSAVPLHNQTTSMSEPHVAEVHGHARAAVPPVHTVISQNLPADNQVRGSGSQSGQAQGYGWAPPNVQSSSGSFPNSGPVSGIQPDVWRPPSQSSQPNLHSPTTPNASWGVAPADNSNPMVVRPQNPNVGWGAMPTNPNMGWGNPAPANANVNWGPAMQGPPPSGNTAAWVPPPANPVGGNMQGMVSGNPNPGWVPTQGWGGAPPIPGPMPGNAWGPPSGTVGAPPAVQGSGQGNANQGWAPWPGEQGPAGGQYSGQRGGQGRDSGFGGARPWSRQSSFGGGGGGGGGGSGPRQHRGTPCPYNANGRCRKGAYCDYMHT